MHKLLTSVLLLLILATPYSVFSHEGEDHSETETETFPQLESGTGWRFVPSKWEALENLFIWYLLITVFIQIKRSIALQ